MNNLLNKFVADYDTMTLYVDSFTVDADAFVIYHDEDHQEDFECKVAAVCEGDPFTDEYGIAARKIDSEKHDFSGEFETEDGIYHYVGLSIVHPGEKKVKTNTPVELFFPVPIRIWVESNEDATDDELIALAKKEALDAYQNGKLDDYKEQSMGIETELDDIAVIMVDREGTQYE